jgi:hypothetical protein|tara:strand:+ start:952 stop:1347 length:396 start_codon:yes stop_codon:yes gene_type:complete
MSKSISYIRNALENINFATFLLACLGAFAALWLNSKYVSNEVYEKDKEILILKITNLETETQAIRYMALSNTEDIKKVLPIVDKIEELISSLITPSGDIIISENMQQLEIDIAEIKKDIEYMKNRLWPTAD